MTRIDERSAIATGAPGNEAPTKKYILAPTFQAAREGISILTRGQRGPAIVQLQRLLNIAGAEPRLDDDGLFGRRTRAAVRAFQREHGLAADGKAGERTIEALVAHVTELVSGRLDTGRTIVSPGPVGHASTALPPPASTGPAVVHTVSGSELAPEPGRVTAPFAPTQAERETQAESILRANGMWPPEEGRTYVIQIDQDSPRASASWRARNRFLRGYTGELVVFRAEGRRLLEQNPAGPLRSASHPGQMSTRNRYVDADGDGDSDIAHLRSGVYDYKARGFTDQDGRYRINPVNNWQLAVARDLDHNGVIDEEEAEARYRATGIQFHAGGQRGPSSVGCQTLPPNDFATFRGLLPERRRDTWTYVLVRRPNDELGANPF